MEVAALARLSKELIKPGNPERPPEDGLWTGPGRALIVNPFDEMLVGDDTAATGRVTEPETIWPGANVTIAPSIWRMATVPAHGSM